MITKELAHELFTLDEDTGDLYWKVQQGKARIGVKVGRVAFNGYVTTSYKGKKMYAHRVVFLMVHGYLPKAIDHIDGDKTNNRPANLRAATYAQNHQNIRRAMSSNKSGYLGVYYNKVRQKWQAAIQVAGKAMYLGLYLTPEEAHNAYIEAKRKHHQFCTL